MQYAWMTIMFTVNPSDVLIINEKNALNCALLILFLHLLLHWSPFYVPNNII